MSRTGRCLCGAVRFTLNIVPAEMEACHCADCRRMTGGPALFGISVPQAALQFQDASAIRVYRSSDWAERGFCPRCGTTLFFRMRGSEQLGLCPGSLEDMNGIALTSEMFVDEKPDGYAFSGPLKQITRAEAYAMLDAFLAGQAAAPTPGKAE